MQDMPDQIIHASRHLGILGQDVYLGFNQFFNGILNKIVEFVCGIYDLCLFRQVELGFQAGLPGY